MIYLIRREIEDDDSLQVINNPYYLKYEFECREDNFYEEILNVFVCVYLIKIILYKIKNTS